MRSSVLKSNEETLALGHAAAALVRAADVLLASLRLADVAVHRRQRRVRHREIGIELDGALEERDRLDVVARGASTEAERVGAQRIERRRRHLLDGQVELLQCRERFAEARADRGREVAERLEHLFAALGVGLLLHQDVPLATLHGRQRQHVQLTERRDRAVDDRGRAKALAHFEGDRSRQSLVARVIAEAQGLDDPFVREDVEERRLAQLHRERLAQRAVEHGVTGPVGELAQDDRVLLGQRRRRVGLTRGPEIAPGRERDGGKQRHNQHGAPRR